jgi:MYXO-CTERM domain-containing protein
MSLVRGKARKALALTMLGSALAVAAGGCVGATPEGEALSQAEAPIIGGSLDTTHKGVVSLLKQVQGGFYPSCSGTLLTQNLVLTAHHCVAGLDSQDGQSVQCGQTEFRNVEAASTILVSVEANVGQEGLNPYRVAQVWVPESNSDVCGKDIALLLLSGSGIPANVAKPIEPGLTVEVEPDALFAAIGYGLQDPNDQRGETAGHRMGVDDAQVFCAGSACGTPMVTETEWIADSPVCSGDSGGPALDQGGRVVGVTSRGDPECTVGIYSSVYAWRDFIIKGAVDAAEAGNYGLPTWAGGSTNPNPSIGGSGGATSTGGNSGGGTSNGSGGKLGGAGTDSGVAGAPTFAGTGAGGQSMSPTIDPLGLVCNGQCPGAYKCWAESGQPPGICVPACSEAAPACPTNFTCSPQLQACVKTEAIKGQSSGDSSSCSVSAPGSSPGSTWLLIGVAAAFGSLRRYRRSALLT